MWSHYGNFHKGYNIGFDFKKMKEYFKGSHYGLINYSREYLDWENEKEKKTKHDKFYFAEAVKWSRMIIFTKSLEWYYEKEYRFTNIFYENKKRITKLPDNFITEVNLGILIKSEHRKEIIKFCKSKKIKVFQLKEVPLKYKLYREQIE